MLIGNIGIATVVATVIISYFKTTQTENWWLNVIILISGLLLLTLAAKSQWVERRLNIAISWGLRKWGKIEVKDYIAVHHLKDGYAVSEMKVEPKRKDKNQKITLRQIVLDDKERFQRMMKLIDLFEKV